MPDLPPPDARRGPRGFARRLREAARRGSSTEERIPALAYGWRYVRWRARCAFGRPVSHEGPERLTVVLLSYQRPQNLQPIVRSLLACRFVDRVHVSNDHPGVRIGDWVPSRDPRVVLVDQPTAQPPFVRYVVARDVPGTHFAFLDDDLFLAPEQVHRLFVALLADPAVPHGMYGQRLRDLRSEVPDQAFENRVHSVDAEVDVLNRAYFLTRAHVDRVWDLHDRLRALAPDVAPDFVDDLLASRSGRGRPRIHDVGPFLDCPSQGNPRLSVWARPGNGEERIKAMRRILAVAEGAPPERPDPSA